MQRLQAIRATVVWYSRALWKHVNEAPIFLWAQAVGFKALVVVVPAAAISLGLFGPNLVRVIRNLVPDLTGGPFMDLLESLQRTGSSLTWMGTVGLGFATMTLFSTLRSVLAGVFNSEAERRRSVVRGYLSDLRMTAQIGVFFLLSIALSFALQAVNLARPDFLTTPGAEGLWIESGWRRLVQVLGFVVPALLSGAVFYQLYRFVPASRPKRASAFAGAAFAAILWELAKVAFAVYASRVGIVSRYETTGSGLGDYFGVIIAFVFWAYYSGIVFILGAYVTLIHQSGTAGGQSTVHGSPDAAEKR